MNSKTNGGPVIEWASFRLKAGVEEEAMLAASETLQEQFLEPLPGYLGRETIRMDGGYADLVRWASRAEADAAMSKAAESTACAAYFALMDFDGEADAPRHYPVIRSYR